MACVDITIRLVGLSSLLSALENLAAKRHFSDDAILGWPVVKRRSRLRGHDFLAKVAEVSFQGRGYVGMQFLRTAAAAVLIVFAGHPLARPAGLLVLLAINLLTHVRHFGLAGTGGDRFRLVLIGALALRELAPSSEAAAYATLGFIAGQCALAYFVAGLAKVNKPEWQRGTALAILLRSPLMGDPIVSAWLNKNRLACRALTWGVLALEVTFPVALIGGTHVAFFFVIAAWAMHLAIGQLMGLAPFVWAFLAGYPAVLLISGQISKNLFH